MSMGCLNRCDVTYGEHVLVSSCEVVGIHWNPARLICHACISYNLRRTMWRSCHEHIVFQVGSILEDDPMVVNLCQFRFRQIFDPSTVQESLNLFANYATCRRNRVGFRGEEVNLSLFLCSPKMLFQKQSQLIGSRWTFYWKS